MFILVTRNFNVKFFSVHWQDLGIGDADGGHSWNASTRTGRVICLCSVGVTTGAYGYKTQTDDSSLGTTQKAEAAGVVQCLV